MLLNPGDLVAIVAPASQMRGADRELLPKAISLLESWKLKVRVQVEEGHHFYLAGHDDARARHLLSAMADPAVRAVFCLRGGYGSPRLFRYLNSDLQPMPKFVIGYSDVTALHVAIGHLWPQVQLIHGPNIATNQLLGDGQAGDLTRQSLRDVLFSSTYCVEEQVEFLRPGFARGNLVGGCLSMLTGTLGTSFALRTSDAILFLEDTGEAPYRIDRMLTHLLNAGKFENVAGVVFGEMRNCRDPHNDLRAVVSDVFSSSTFPVGFGLRSGHGEVNLSLRLGRSAEINSERGLFRLAPDLYAPPPL